jgi:hypothetical protein
MNDIQRTPSKRLLQANSQDFLASNLSRSPSHRVSSAPECTTNASPSRASRTTARRRITQQPGTGINQVQSSYTLEPTDSQPFVIHPGDHPARHPLRSRLTQQLSSSVARSAAHCSPFSPQASPELLTLRDRQTCVKNEAPRNRSQSRASASEPVTPEITRLCRCCCPGINGKMPPCMQSTRVQHVVASVTCRRGKDRGQSVHRCIAWEAPEHAPRRIRSSEKSSTIVASDHRQGQLPVLTSFFVPAYCTHCSGARSPPLMHIH